VTPGSRQPCAAAAATLVLAACAGGSSGGGGLAGPDPPGGGTGGSAAFCTTKDFTPPADSPYRLPYAAGATFTMFQGNCPANPLWGHHGKFAYDFAMPIGTPVHAMRAGSVIFTEDRYLDTDHTPGHENGIWIEHEDGTVADYLHFTTSSVVPAVGEDVQAGDLLGFSGHSGGSDRPHLHVEVFATRGNYVKSNTLPVTFSNLEGETAPSGELLEGNAYTALASDSASASAR
jgi:murein DD-endopeptidase MepM/ murein hydrolase activator NlpD